MSIHFNYTFTVTSGTTVRPDHVNNLRDAVTTGFDSLEAAQGNVLQFDSPIAEIVLGATYNNTLMGFDSDSNPFLYDIALLDTAVSATAASAAAASGSASSATSSASSASSSASSATGSASTATTKAGEASVSAAEAAQSAIDAALAAGAQNHSHSNLGILDSTTASFTTAEESKLAGIASGANNYSHFTGGVGLGAALTGANVISDVSVNTEGHVIGFATRALTLANLGYTGASNANNYSHPNHSGDVTSSGDGPTTLSAAAITGKSALTSGLANTDELLVSDGGVLKRMDMSVVVAYLQSTFFTESEVTSLLNQKASLAGSIVQTFGVAPPSANNHAIRRDTFATATTGGTVKMRVSGGVLYIRNDGVNA